MSKFWLFFDGKARVMPAPRPLALPPGIVAIETYIAEAAGLGAKGIMAGTAKTAEYIHQVAAGEKMVYKVLTDYTYNVLAEARLAGVSAGVRYLTEILAGADKRLPIRTAETYTPIPTASIEDKLIVRSAYSTHIAIENGRVGLAWDVGQVKIGQIFSVSELARAELNPTWVPKLSLNANTSSLTVMPGEPYTVMYIVENKSNLPAGFTLTIYDHSGSVAYTASRSLNPGDLATYRVTLSAPNKGIYTVRGCVYNETTKRTDSCVDVRLAVGAQ